VSAQDEEDLEGVGLQSRWEISAMNYKSALCFFAALILQSNTQRVRWERRGRDEGRGDKIIVTSMAMIGRLYHTLFSLVLDAFYNRAMFVDKFIRGSPNTKIVSIVKWFKSFFLVNWYFLILSIVPRRFLWS